MTKQSKDPCLKRLSRIEGQVRGLARIVEQDRYCIDIVTPRPSARHCDASRKKSCVTTFPTVLSTLSSAATPQNKGARSPS